jgi:RNA polymerase sigma-70 factor (ECF subfamily)
MDQTAKNRPPEDDRDDSSEAALVAKALLGDAQAFEQLIDRYASLVYAQAFALLQDHQEAEDVAQESFTRAYQFRVRLRNPQRFRPWLLSITRNLARDRLRRLTRMMPVPEPGILADPSSSQDEPFLHMVRAEEHVRLRRALAGLPDHWRDVVTLRHLQGWSHARIEERLGLTNGAVRGLLGRAMRALRQALRRQEP